MTIQDFSNALIAQTEKVIIGKRQQIELITAALLSGGHILLEDLPGSGKTTLVRTLSIALGCESKRIQFVPDLLPSDILGAKIFNQKIGDFDFKQGPVVTNLLLADEINRAIPRTQSALLEAMEETQISVDGVSLKLPEPFIVLATQNPIEMESTFPLPAAQMDRFFICLSLGYPSMEQEKQMLLSQTGKNKYDGVQAITDALGWISLQNQVAEVSVNEYVRQYIVSLVQATRTHELTSMGASPRASLNLYKGSQAWAAMHGRSYATPDDVKSIALPVLSHRIVLKSEARASGKTTADVINDILNSTPIPPAKEAVLLEE